MVRIFFFLFCFIGCAHQLSAQFFPKEGAQLCYRLIGFSFPAEAGVTDYKIEVAIGTYGVAGDFEKHIALSVPCRKSKMICEVPFFGAHYTWRTTSIVNGKVKTKSVLRHFETRITPDVDTNITRLRVMHKAEKYRDAYFFIDETRVLYDMNGKPVWFLPCAKGPDKATDPRDIKMTPQGTITFIQGCQPHEVDYNGKVVWQYSGHITNGLIDTFHHDFTRLPNGHYMGLVLDKTLLKRPQYQDKVASNSTDSAKYFRNIRYSNIVELDENGQLVWKWDGLNYIEHSDLLFMENTDLPDIDLNFHQNAFYYDGGKSILLSFRDIWRVLKINYPGGNVTNTYGPVYHEHDSTLEGGPFCYQHSSRSSRNGNLYLFNNNQCGAPAIPTVMMLRETIPGGDKLEKVWEYKCTIEDPGVAAMKDLKFISGGTVLELPDGSLLVAMGAPYPKVFIVSRGKKVLWSVMPEKYNRDTGKWRPVNSLYRASFIASRKELEPLIWNSEKE